MNRGSNPILDLIRLLLLVILLPLIVLVAGPLLVIAAIRGSASLGRLQLRPGKYYQGGRLWAFVLGFLIWGITWAGIAWFWPANLSLPGILRPPTKLIVQQVASPTPAQIRLPATPSALPTATPEPPVAINTPLRPATDTPPPPPTATPLPTATPIPPPSPPRETAPPTVTLPPPPPPALQADGLSQTLNEANTLLTQYLQDTSPTNQAELEAIWVDDALREVQAFARQINVRYQKPLTVTYSLIGEPAITPLDDISVMMRSRELWTFEDPERQKTSLSDYQYTLQAKEGRWHIVDYRFTVLPPPSPPITTTTVITSDDSGR